MSYSLSDAVSDSVTVTMTAPSQTSSPSQGVTVTSVVNDIIYAVSVVLDSIARAIIEFAPFLIAFPSAVFIVGRAYNAVRGVIGLYFGRYFRV